MFLNVIKKLWEWLNTISPSNRNLIIFLLLGFIFYSLITEKTRQFILKWADDTVQTEKRAEQYTKDMAIEINRQVKLIAEKDEDAFDVLLLNYHNNTQSLLGFKYLYLSCLTEAPRSIDTPLLKLLWNNIDYIYYADELYKIHGQSIVLINNLDLMAKLLPKMYHLIKSSDAQAVTFVTIEGKEDPIGMVVVLYKKSKVYSINYQREFLPIIQRLAVLLDYNNYTQ